MAPSAFPRPLVIAHRGASGERPEHTRAAYELAIDQGADFIEPDLVMSRDGVLVVRHENDISATTDVADRPEFADRRAIRSVDGVPVDGWFTEDFTLDELKTLGARERLPDLRPGNTAHDGREPILTFDEVLAIAREGAARAGRVVGVAPELKHPTFFAEAGLPMEDAFVAALEAHGLAGADAPLIVQCFETGPLRRLGRRIGAPMLQLIERHGGPWDRPGLAYARMLTPRGLADIAAYARIIGTHADWIIPRDADGRARAPSGLIAQAHEAGLQVHAWTLRAENHFLPRDHRQGEDPAAHGALGAWLDALYAAGVDGVFCDFPAMAVAARHRG